MSVLSSIIDKSISGGFSSSVCVLRNFVFQDCTGLSTISFPNVLEIGKGAFSGCTGLTNVYFPRVTKTNYQVFLGCTGLISVSFPYIAFIGADTFKNCSNLNSIYIGTKTFEVCTFYDAFEGCSSLTNIYVPNNLVDKYKSATNWSKYADKIKAAP